MKRAGIRRYTELKRVPMKPRTKPMKKVSAKRAKLLRKVKPFRKAYIAAHWLCEVCLKRESVDVHEIFGGPDREKSLDKEFAVLAVCRECHDALHDRKKWPFRRVLTLKVIRAPELFGLNMDPINELRGNSETEFDMTECFQQWASLR